MTIAQETIETMVNVANKLNCVESYQGDLMRDVQFIMGDRFEENRPIVWCLRKYGTFLAQLTPEHKTELVRCVESFDFNYGQNNYVIVIINKGEIVLETNGQQEAINYIWDYGHVASYSGTLGSYVD